MSGYAVLDYAEEWNLKSNVITLNALAQVAGQNPQKSALQSLYIVNSVAS